MANSERKITLDTPTLVGGALEAPVRGNLEISGWALARGGVAAIEIAVDQVPFAVADYGMRRLDIQDAFPDWDGALGSGFLALLHHRVLPKGSHVITVSLRDNLGKTASIDFRIEVEELSESSGPWSLRRKMAPAEIDLDLRLLAHRQWHPAFNFVLPMAGDRDALRQARSTLASLRSQPYRNWRVWVASQAPGGRLGLIRDELLDGFEDIAGQVDIVRAVTPRLIAGAGTEDAGGDSEAFVAVLSPGDELGCDALLELALASTLSGEADFLYSDERRLNPDTGQIDAYFKPDWSPDLILSTNYVGRLWCARADLLGAVATPAEDLLRHGEYDLVLRCTEAAQAIRHLPAVLCERADEPNDDDEAQRALERAVARRGIAGEILVGLAPGTFRLKREIATQGMVSIIIPTCAAGGLIQTCIETLRRVTEYRDFEIVCIENIPAGEEKWREWLQRNADWVVSTTEPFNWSRFNNLAAVQTTGDFLLFLNDDIEIIDPHWLDTLLEHAQRPEIGIVGPQLLYPDRRVQHAGMFLAAMGQGRHAFRYAREDDPGYFGLALTQRNVIAVTGACLLTRRETFDALGGFDEAHVIVNNDLDYCLRVWQSGLSTVYTPHATLIHHEAVSRAAMADDFDPAAFDSKWRSLFLAGDPFFNPNLARNRDDYSADTEPTQILFSGRPTLARDQIRKILVVKLDHIGDCVIAFPAVRRLKQFFPNARISVLTSRASKAVWAMEPCVEETIEFNFFHARSALGEIERTDEDWRELRERLDGEHFDLAVDLRKHPETRHVLQHTGARHLAGFDHRDRFPWLDVALAWGGDQAYARKRQHAGDDLVNLVDAIGAACDADRLVIASSPRGTSSSPLPGSKRKRPSPRPLVCVHPTAGNDMKQWPLEYFAAVIDRLVEEDDASIVLIGGPGDEAIASEVQRQLRHPDAVSSLVGKVPLGDLPAFLAEAALFLGNDSGPKHLAAGLGVPTVGVHSGTVDVREWGPVGPSAVAVARDVVCSPCYLAKLEDCHRDLACLRQLSPDTVYQACKRLLLMSTPAHRSPRRENYREPPPGKRGVRAPKPSGAVSDVHAAPLVQIAKPSADVDASS